MLKPAIPPAPAVTSAQTREKPKPVYGEPGQARVQALRMVWPIVCRRLEEFPNINAMQLFEEPKSCAFSFQVGLPANSTKRSSSGSVSGARRLEHAASSLGPRPIVGSATNRVVDVPISSGTIGKRWLDALKSSRIRPHSNSSSSSRTRHPGRYSLRQLYSLQKRVRAWRQQAVQRLIGEVSGLASYVAPDPARLAAGNILDEAVGNKIT